MRALSNRDSIVEVVARESREVPFCAAPDCWFSSPVFDSTHMQLHQIDLVARGLDAEPRKSHVDNKSLEGMRKFSEQYARRYDYLIGRLVMPR